ncbi:MAG: ABC transporter ATP-binding protein [Eubacteriales bacterium]|nr:ABC transporter ATP-binding protein [Eubacteriales bacterium]
MKEKLKPKKPLQTFKRVFEYLGRYKLQLVVVLFFVVVSTGANIAGTYFLKPLINNHIVPFIGHKDPDLSKFISMLVLMASIYLLGVVSTYIFHRMMLKISTGTLLKIRTDLFKHIQSLPIKYFDTNSHGDIMSRFTNDIDAVREMLGEVLVQLLSSLINIVGVFTVMIILSPVLTLLVVGMLAVMIFTVKKLGAKSSSYFMKQQRSIGIVNGYIEEMTEGQKVVKVFNHENKVKGKFNELVEDLYKAAKGANTFASMLRPIMFNLSYVLYSLTAMAGATLIVSGGMDIGTLASFLQYTRNFSNPITALSQMFNAVLYALAGAERIFDALDEKPEVDDGYVTLVHALVDKDGTVTESAERTGIWAWKHPHKDGKLTYTILKGDITFSNVVFGYDENVSVLKSINLYAKPGQKIAFVGSTGAGKTTVTNLINRFYDIPDGKIRYDGININKISKKDLRRSLAMVLQDTHLFSGTVMENIRYGKLDATDEEVISAAKLANADSFIRHLPQGYDTELTADGANLSQGQRQLLSIARAAVADPPVLILDEATSSIDTRTESLIEKGMDRLMEGRTVFVIAHRLSTVRNSDAILVLEQGEIIERGDHDELLALRGRYFQLYTGMFELA